MGYISWDSSLDVLVGNMNSEHKTWINFINKLHETVQANKPSAEVITSYDAMFDYTKVHFNNEEKYLRSIDYPIFDTHKKAHEDFLQELVDARLELNRKGSISDDFFRTLKGWLIRHIQIVDSQYGEYTQRKAKAS